MVTAGLLNKQIAARVESQRDYGENSPAAHDGKDAGGFAR